MDQGQSLFSQPSFWISIGSVIAAWIAAIFAYLNGRRSQRALRMAEQQEERRRLKIKPYLVEGYSRTLPSGGARGYAFSVSLGNPSDSNNAIVRAELLIGYTAESSAYLVFKVPPDPSIAKSLGLASDSLLQLPHKIEAHQTLESWLAFRVDDGLVGAGRIDELAIVFTDSDENASALQPTIIREIVDETEGDKGTN